VFRHRIVWQSSGWGRQPRSDADEEDPEGKLVTAPHVILGNGAAALAAIKAIRRRDRRTDIVVVAAESLAAYSPALLPYVISGRLSERRLELTDRAFYAAHGVTVMPGRRAVELQPGEHRVLLDDGQEVAYGRLLVATGASAKGSVVTGAVEGEPLTLRSLDDARRIRAKAAGCTAACILGAGLAGLEMAMALRELGKDVSVVATSGQILSRNAGPDEARVVQGLLEAAGIRFLLRRSVAGLEHAAGARMLLTNEGDQVPADLLVAAKGARPNVGSMSGATGSAGFQPVDERMRTELPDVLAAGDVALSRDAVSGEPRAFTTWPSACLEGSVAGSTMAGGTASVERQIAFNVLPVFRSSAAFVGETAEGTRTPDTEVVVWRGSRPERGLYRRLYLRGDRIVGAVVIGACRDAGLLRCLVETGAGLSSSAQTEVLAGCGWGALKGRCLPRL
jgi:nitrite reductase (NADH) large subunit